MKVFRDLQGCLGLNKVDRLCHASGDTLLIFTPMMNEPPVLQKVNLQVLQPSHQLVLQSALLHLLPLT